MSKHPLLNKSAPTITLPDANGEPFTFTPGTQGKPAVVFFVPSVGTYGCSREMCGFRDALVDGRDFSNANVQLVGIGPNPVTDIKKWTDNNKINYPVLSDEKGDARKAFQCGKGLMGLSEGRLSFIIDKEGVIRDVMDSVLNYNGHVKFALQAIEKFGAESKAAEPAASS
ncbi:peroxiredoxin Q [Vararia minispora EC-137]|uniref:Peroxiredoxin Q n=1 Tax=Vararia minispora EC-137 TaxID=1314806 RepID=A0ACB8QUL3_9AGAM|nr:peroxiredoxin Q [Vararia minispora EC-137]